jgi:hypothetical protein
MIIEPGSPDINVFIRTTKWAAADLPRHCDIDMQLPSWDAPPVLAVAFLLRLARDELLTYQTWINAGNANGICLLQNMASRDHFRIHIVTDQIERCLRTHNIVRRQAVAHTRRVGPRRDGWSQKAFDEIRQRIDTLYPTPAKLWQTGREAALRPVRR